MLAAVRLSMLAALAAALVAGEAKAQRARNYKADEVDKSLSRRGGTIRQFVSRGDGDRAEFEAYFTKYYLPAMTDPSSEALGLLGKRSGDLFKNYIYKAQDASVQKWLSDRALAWGKRVAADSGYHPSVRLNAVLVVGRIDDKYNADSPAPSAQGNQFLCQIVAAGVATPRMPKYLLTGALTGMERHTRYLSALPAANRRATVERLVGVLRTDTLPGEYADGVRDWVYLQAAQGLANLKTAGPVKAMAGRIVDENLALDTRLEIAAMLQQLNLKPDEALAGPMVRVMSALATAVAERELNLAEQFEDKRVNRGAVLSGAGGSRDSTKGRLVVDERGRDVQIVREPLVDALHSLQQAVRAVNQLAGEDGQAMLNRIDSAITPALEAATDQELTGDLTVAAKVKAMAREIQAAASPALAPVAAG